MTPLRWAVDLMLIAAGVVSVLFEPTSIAIHSVVGLVFVGTVGPHLWNRRAWIRGTARRLWKRRRLTRVLRWNLAQAVVLLVLVVVMTVSGLWDWLVVPTKIRWHAISSVILIAVTSGQLTLVMLSAFPALIGVAVLFGRLIRRNSRDAQDRLADSNVVVE